MLALPQAGWSTITVFNTVLGAASYVEDVPFMVLDAFINWFQAKKDNRYCSFTLEFDREEKGTFGLVALHDTLYRFETFTDEPEVVLTAIPLASDSLYESLCLLAQESYKDIRDHLGVWALWFSDNALDMATIKQELNTRCAQLASLLQTSIS